MESKNMVTIVDPQNGKVISMVGDTYRILISGKQTGNAYSVVDMMIPPNGGPGPHTHVATQEAFYIVDGEIEVTTEAGAYSVTKGAYVNIPFNGPAHQFKNKSNQPAHLLCILTPAGMEQMFLELGQPTGIGTYLPPPEMTPALHEKMKSVAEKYGNELYPPDYFGKRNSSDK